MSLDNLFEYLKKQGFSIFILCCAIYWFNKKYDASEKKYDELNVYVRTELKQTIDNNTKAYQDFKSELQNHK
jgi:hypothetical protein